MKKYQSLGELLQDYRKRQGISQSEFAIKMNADIRTIQRWEKNKTLIKEEKVAVLVEETLLPLQLIRNLNSIDPIPIYFDFDTWKYSLSELSIELPEADWYKLKMDAKTERIRKIDLSFDFEFIVNTLSIPKENRKTLKEVFQEAIHHLPELNLIITDELGNYSGLAITLPITQETFALLRTGDVELNDLGIHHITDQEFQDQKIFLSYKLSADSNENIQYLIGSVLSYFKTLQDQDYVFCDLEHREDGFHLPAQLGLKESLRTNTKSGNEYFYFGDFKQFLKGG